jgi:hypothetical protein
MANRIYVGSYLDILNAADFEGLDLPWWIDQLQQSQVSPWVDTQQART